MQRFLCNAKWTCYKSPRETCSKHKMIEGPLHWRVQYDSRENLDEGNILFTVARQKLSDKYLAILNQPSLLVNFSFVFTKAISLIQSFQHSDFLSTLVKYIRKTHASKAQSNDYFIHPGVCTCRRGIIGNQCTAVRNGYFFPNFTHVTSEVEMTSTGNYEYFWLRKDYRSLYLGE